MLVIIRPFPLASINGPSQKKKKIDDTLICYFNQDSGRKRQKPGVAQLRGKAGMFTGLRSDRNGTGQVASWNQDTEAIELWFPRVSWNRSGFGPSRCRPGNEGVSVRVCVRVDRQGGDGR